MSKLATLWSYIRRHKYLITILSFLVIIVFLDENSLIQRAKHRREINALTSEIEKYRKQYEEEDMKRREVAAELAAKEAERERIRAEKRAECLDVSESVLQSQHRRSRADKRRKKFRKLRIRRCF